MFLSKYNCQQTKDAVSSNKEMFVEFAAQCLSCEKFIRAMNVLLPFDKVARMKMANDDSPIESIGLSVMHMDFQPSLFMFGISIDIIEGANNKAINTTIIISACKTLEQLREYVKSDRFSRQVRENFSKQIELCFSSQDRISCFFSDRLWLLAPLF